jgi:hypothetical protein
MFVACAIVIYPAWISVPRSRHPAGDSFPGSRQTISIIMRIIAALAVAMVISGCAPEPNTPSSDSLAGVWTSTAHLNSLSNLRMNIVQEPKGIVSGTWSALRDAGTGNCPTGAPCEENGELIGRNTVAQVQIEIIGTGRFEGAQIEENQLRGVLVVGEALDNITFLRTGQ